MRKDMAKVIVERPRSNRGYAFPRSVPVEGKRLTLEDLPSRHGIRRVWRNGTRKMLNENLAPLRRFLRTNVGRPWNKVYSEICQQINRDSAVQLHVWQHLMQDVCLDPHVISGDVQRGFFGWRWFVRFYVDPKTGLLGENVSQRPPWRRPRPPNPDRIEIDSSREYRRLDGIWYELELATPPLDRPVYDFSFRRTTDQLTPTQLREFYGRYVYAVSKRQLNSREIRRLPAQAANRK